jgi:hypothetical protein
MDRAGDWRRLCALLDDDEAVWEAVESALEAGDDPWDALIGGLDDAGALAYLQADDTGMELSDALAQLPRVFALQPDLDAVTDTDDLVAAMQAADAALSEGGLRLACLLEPDDENSRPIVAVAAGRSEELVGLAGVLGCGVVLGE